MKFLSQVLRRQSEIPKIFESRRRKGYSFLQLQFELSWYLHQPESYQLSIAKVFESLMDQQTSGPIDRTQVQPGRHRRPGKAAVSCGKLLR